MFLSISSNGTKNINNAVLICSDQRDQDQSSETKTKTGTLLVSIVLVSISRPTPRLELYEFQLRDQVLDQGYG